MTRATVYKNPLLAISAPLLVLLIHFVALRGDIYNRILHFDSLMHLLGGIACALSLFWALWQGARLGLWQLGSPILNRALVVGLVSVITIGWEVFELLVYAYWQPSIRDTLKDEVLGIVGALAVAGFIKLEPR